VRLAAERERDLLARVAQVTHDGHRVALHVLEESDVLAQGGVAVQARTDARQLEVRVHGLGHAQEAARSLEARQQLVQVFHRNYLRSALRAGYVPLWLDDDSLPVIEGNAKAVADAATNQWLVAQCGYKD
jgi:hypothetical protein